MGINVKDVNFELVVFFRNLINGKEKALDRIVDAVMVEGKKPEDIASEILSNIEDFLREVNDSHMHFYPYESIMFIGNEFEGSAYPAGVITDENAHFTAYTFMLNEEYELLVSHIVNLDMEKSVGSSISHKSNLLHYREWSIIDIIENAHKDE